MVVSHFLLAFFTFQCHALSESLCRQVCVGTGSVLACLLLQLQLLDQLFPLSPLIFHRNLPFIRGLSRLSLFPKLIDLLSLVQFHAVLMTVAL